MENTKPLELTICYRASYSDENMAIHASGCSDIARNEIRKYGANVVTHVGSLESAINRALDEEMREMGYDESHLKVYPCCNK